VLARADPGATIALVAIMALINVGLVAALWSEQRQSVRSMVGQL